MGLATAICKLYVKFLTYLKIKSMQNRSHYSSSNSNNHNEIENFSLQRNILPADGEIWGGLKKMLNIE